MKNILTVAVLLAAATLTIPAYAENAEEAYQQLLADLHDEFHAEMESATTGDTKHDLAVDPLGKYDAVLDILDRNKHILYKRYAEGGPQKMQEAADILIGIAARGHAGHHTKTVEPANPAGPAQGLDFLMDRLGKLDALIAKERALFEERLEMLDSGAAQGYTRESLTEKWHETRDGLEYRKYELARGYWGLDGTTPGHPTEGTLTISGEASGYLEDDMQRVRLHVRTEGPTAEQAVSLNHMKVGSVRLAVEGTGAEATRTGLVLAREPLYSMHGYTEASKYVANSVILASVPIEDAGALMDAGVLAGATSAYTDSFPSKAVKSETKAKLVKEALEGALAEATAELDARGLFVTGLAGVDVTERSSHEKMFVTLEAAFEYGMKPPNTIETLDARLENGKLMVAGITSTNIGTFGDVSPVTQVTVGNLTLVPGADGWQVLSNWEPLEGVSATWQITMHSKLGPGISKFVLVVSSDSGDVSGYLGDAASVSVIVGGLHDGGPPPAVRSVEIRGQ